MIFLFILSFVGDFVIAIIIVNLILFYLARGLAWWHPYCKTRNFWRKVECQKCVKWILEGLVIDCQGGRHTDTVIIIKRCIHVGKC